MRSGMAKGGDTTTFGNPEINALFKDWLAQINEELLTFLREEKSLDLDKVAEKFKISKDSAAYLITELSKKEGVDLKAELK
jgi:hypothetical protein